MIITIGRQHGSNGHDIACALANELGYECYDKEIVDHAAERSGLCREIFDTYDERKVSAYVMSSPHYIGMTESFRLNMQIATAQFDTIRHLAEKGNSIFVGRCADYILRERSDLVRVFILANMDFRIKTMMKRRDLTAEQAKRLIREVDRDRSSYYKYYSDQVWGEAGNYDLCIDSSRVGVAGAVEVIKAYISALSE